MKIVCPKCSRTATLSDDFGSVECGECGLMMTYSQYLQIMADRLATKEEPP